ncbi:MAG: DNA polymerase III subunit beta [Deltaproteobacteria bacterium]|nr:DNA polymerase III subunit beta [Deltaproteobacteria bacterium]MCL4873846.1 DNA polymerase III subunit beta [bacterium]
MKFDIKRESFLRALQRVQGTVEKSGTQPILANVLIGAGKEGEVTVSATDLELFTRDICEGAVSKPGSVTVNARKLFEIVKGLSAEEVSFEAGKDHKVEIKGGRSRFKVLGLSEKDFPSPPEIDPTGLVRMDSDFLRDMIDKTSFAVSKDETRYNIHGFFLQRGGGVTRMVTTDGHRLAVIERPGPAGEMKSVLIPRKGAIEIRKLLGEGESEVLFGATDKRAALMAGNAAMSVRLLEGEFPDFERVIPKDNGLTVLAPKGAFIECVRRVSILSDSKAHGVKLAFRAGSLTASAFQELGEASEDLDIEYDGPETETAYNSGYLLDALEAMPGEKVRLLLKDGLSPALLRPEDSDHYTSVIMPMRL